MPTPKLEQSTGRNATLRSRRGDGNVVVESEGEVPRQGRRRRARESIGRPNSLLPERWFGQRACVGPRQGHARSHRPEDLEVAWKRSELRGSERSRGPGARQRREARTNWAPLRQRSPVAARSPHRSCADPTVHGCSDPKSRPRRRNTARSAHELPRDDAAPRRSCAARVWPRLAQVRARIPGFGRARKRSG